MPLNGFTIEEETKFLDGVELTNVMNDYANSYGYSKLIERLISANSMIKGGISFNNAKSQLSNSIKSFSR